MLAAFIVALSANSGAAKIIITLLLAICVVYVSVSNKQMTLTNLQNLADKELLGTLNQVVLICCSDWSEVFPLP